MINKKTVIVIPAYNPGDNMCLYVESLIERGAEHIIVVDDGSSSDSVGVFHTLEDNSACDVIHHDVNKGKGRALKSAMKFYRQKYVPEDSLGIVTADSDGQHSVGDVESISMAITKDCDSLVLGERSFDKDTPLRSKFGNTCTSGIFSVLYGIKLQDTQTGLRGIPNRLLPLFEELDGDRYEYEMNMLIACSKQKIPISSIPIKTVYINENKGSHFRPFVDSVKIYRLILRTFLKYAFISLSSFAADIGLFELFVLLFRNNKPTGYIMLATICARVCSSVFNFLMNRSIVFKSKEKLTVTAIKYYALCIAQMLISGLLVSLIHVALPAAEVVIKIIVDTVLFLISFQIQNKWIFK